MSLLPKRKVTARMQAANRQNALKSTGPLTPEGKQRSRFNSLKHGLTSRALRETMVYLGEDPGEYDRFQAGLAESLKPANALEAKLVEEMAQLWWRKARAVRAQSGVQLREVERLEFERLRKLHDLHRKVIDESREEILEAGLRRAKDDPAQFSEALEILKVLVHEVEHRQFTEEAEGAFRALYGKQPTWRGSLIISMHRELREAALDDSSETPEPAVEATATSREHDSPATNRRLLLILLNEEIRDVIEEHSLLLEENFEISRAMVDARLAPSDSRWTFILRQDASLDRQIERKMRMFIQLRRAVRMDYKWR